MKNHMHIVIYDGGCGVCTRMAQWLARIDKNNSMLIIPGFDAGDYLEKFYVPTGMTEKTLVLIDINGNVYYYARSIFEIMKRLPDFLGFAGKLLANNFFAAMFKPVYLLFARNRRRISLMLGMDACKVDFTPEQSE